MTPESPYGIERNHRTGSLAQRDCDGPMPRDTLGCMEKTGEMNRSRSSLRRASTVILVRDGYQEDLQVYLLRRSAQSGFLPGLYVFPGGTLEASDWDPRLWEDRLDEPQEQALGRLGGDLSPEEAMAHVVGGIRETFEEAGVLLALQEAAQDLKTPSCPLQPTARGAGKGWFRDKVIEEGLRLQVSRLAPWAHWLTPESMPRRFDTRFYLAVHPTWQSCFPDQMETTHGLWIRPLDAILGNHEGAIPLSPPTLVTMQELLEFPDIKSLCTRAWNRPWGRPRLPKARRTPWGPMLLLPWDPQYGSHDPQEESRDQEPQDLPPLYPFSRLIQRGGIWRPVSS